MRKPKPLDPIRFNCAVKALALYSAKQRVKEQIRARGEKVAHYSCREITALGEEYFASHMEELLAQALVDVWKLPSFARYRPASAIG